VERTRTLDIHVRYLSGREKEDGHLTGKFG
jgi:hypothetical protein